MCTLYVLIHLSGTNTPHRQYWLQLPLRIAHSPSSANGGAPVPAPMVALLFRRMLTFVRPTPVPPSPHQVHLSNSSLICSNQPSNGGAPVLSLPFRRVLTTIHPSPANAPFVHHSHPTYLYHLSHPCIQPLLSDTIQFQFQLQLQQYRAISISRNTAIQQKQHSDAI